MRRRSLLFIRMQLARSREARPFGAAFGSRSGGCHAARISEFLTR
ncbi:MAG: hypothetical protein NT164_02895 [Verrucomicrobiae bacterium]|nr:hypothetical protein [Verrucomicrobiae bacterium]